MKHPFAPYLAAVSLFAALIGYAIAAPSAQDFVQKAAIAGQFEISSSQLALQNSQNDDVKAFARQMIEDHTQASNDLKAVVSSTHPADTVQPSPGLDAKHQKMVDKLSKYTGAEFDKRYIHEQTDAHKEAVALFKDYAQNGDNDALKAFAAKTLPTLKEHFNNVKQLHADEASQ